MSDDERALSGRDRRRTPPRGVPTIGDGDEFTPVTDLLDMIDDPQLKRIVRLMWEHTANVELRSEQRIGRGIDVLEHIEDDARVHAEIRVAIADIRGEKGENGKLGELRRRVDALYSRGWWVLTTAIGGLMAALIKVVMVTRAFDAVDSRSQRNLEEMQSLRAQVLTLQGAVATRANQ